MSEAKPSNSQDPAEPRQQLAISSPEQAFSFTPKNMDEALKFAEMISKSELVPKDFFNKPGNVLVAVQMGLEVGLKPMQALQNIAVINGRPSMWGDAVLALVKSSRLCEYVIEEFDETLMVATCRTKRLGEPNENLRKFSKADAEKAGLWGKSPSPWQTYPKRMLQMRARSWALRDTYPDVLKGLQVREEMEDVERAIAPKRVTMPQRVSEQGKPAAEPVDAETLPALSAPQQELWTAVMTLANQNEAIAFDVLEKLTAGKRGAQAIKGKRNVRECNDALCAYALRKVKGQAAATQINEAFPGAEPVKEEAAT